MASLLEALIKALSGVTLPKVDMPKLPKHELDMKAGGDNVTHNYLCQSKQNYCNKGVGLAN